MTTKPRRKSPKSWMIVSQTVAASPEGAIRVTIEVPFDGKFLRGSRRLPNVLKLNQPKPVEARQ